MNEINWNETYSNISPKLLGICRRYIKDIATAEDIVQDSFIVAIQKENSLKDKNAINGWLSRIVINMAINYLKENKKTVFSETENFEIIDNSSLMNTLELDNKSMLLSSDLDSNDVLEAIDSLTEHHKSVFNMYVIDQFSHNEIAKTLDISVGTSKSHLSRARKSIQIFLLDKIKGKPIDKEKKRRVAFFIFLGFGNSMFANFYQSKFNNFEIAPKNTFSFSSKTVSAPKQFIGLKKGISLSKISFGILSLVAIYFVVFSFFKSNLPENKPKMKTEKTTKIQAVKQVFDTTKNEKSAVKTNPTKEISEIKNEKKIYKITSSKKEVFPKKDTLTETPKVVVIKKQIIKRDTIYVTK